MCVYVWVCVPACAYDIFVCTHTSSVSLSLSLSPSLPLSHIHTHIHTHTQAGARQANVQVHLQAVKQEDNQADRLADRQAGRQAGLLAGWQAVTHCVWKRLKGMLFYQISFGCYIRSLLAVGRDAHRDSFGKRLQASARV